MLLPIAVNLSAADLLTRYTALIVSIFSNYWISYTETKTRSQILVSWTPLSGEPCLPTDAEAPMELPCHRLEALLHAAQVSIALALVELRGRLESLLLLQHRSCIAAQVVASTPEHHFKASAEFLNMPQLFSAAQAN